MASTENENNSDSDEFIRNLVGLPDAVSMEVDPNALSNEIRNLEEQASVSVSEERQNNAQCPKCGRRLSNPCNLKRHLKQGSCKQNVVAPRRCEKCMRLFSTAGNLKRHRQSARCYDSETAERKKKIANRCEACNKSFSNASNVRKHLKNGSCRNVCCHCSERIPGPVGNIRTHIQRHINEEYLTVPQLQALRKQRRMLRATGSKKEKSSSRNQPPSTHPNSDISSSSSSSESSDSDQQADEFPAYEQERIPNFNNTLVRFKIRPTAEEKQDMTLLFANRRNQLSRNIKTEMRRMRAVKWYVCVSVKMTKYTPEGDVKDQAQPTFRSVSQTALLEDDIPGQLDAAYFKICDSLEKFKADGSGWRLDDIMFLEQTLLKYNPLRGSCSDYVMPERLKRKACLLSVVGVPGNSMECFRWAVLAGLHAPSHVTGEIHWTELGQHRNALNFDGIENRGKRMQLSQIHDFEKNNNVSINILGYINEPFPLHISKNLDSNTNRHINLLLVSYSDKETGDNSSESDGHYCLIQDMSRLLCGEKIKINRRLFYCMRCLNPSYSMEKLAEHELFCNELQPMNARPVSEEKKWLEFKNYRRQLECPFLIVADFGCYRRKIYDKTEPVEGHTVRERRLEPCAFAYLRISRNDSHPTEPVVHVGVDPDDTMMRFLKCMEDEQRDVFHILSQKQPAVLCDTGVRNLMNSNEACYVCSTPFLPGDKICADHDHITGVFRGNACNRCNLALAEPKFLPIFCHGLSKFGARLIMSAVGKYGHRNITVLPQSVDTYISIMIDKCRYLDSERFLNAPLGTLVESATSESGPRAFRYLSRYIQNDHLELFSRQHPFCHDYLDGPDKLSETRLPPKSEFFDTINETDISDDDYQHAQTLWTAMEMCSLKDFLESYLLSNVLLLTDVLSIFRKTMIDTFRLDPIQYFSLSGYSFDCALRHTETKLELLTDLEMHQMIESSIRGGLATIGSPRYAKANNPDLPDQQYESDKPTSFIHFFDFNGLYTSVMKNHRLPTYGFRWLSESEIERFDLMSVASDSDHGYIIECDLDYPEHLHDAQDSFPLAPEHIRIKPEDLSEYTRNLAEQCGIGLDSLREIRKLCLTLKDKKHYVSHYLNLQFYVKHGMILRKVHRVIRFTQSPWLEDFMTKVSDKRREAKTKFYSTVFKAVPNSVYGKLLESVRSHKDVRICTTSEKLHKLVSRPTFATLHEFGEDLAAVQMHKEKVTLNRPYAVGFCVLELAKLETYKFYYEFIIPAFKDGQVSLLMQDTDSFLLHILGYENINGILRENANLFDFSNLPQDHMLKDDSNKMKPGCVKFELGAATCFEFCAVSPKCYSLQTDGGFKQTLKGSRKKLSHEMYKHCLLQEQCQVENVRDIKNYGQALYQVSVRRRLLTPVDLKRYYLNSIFSLSFGHYRLEETEKEDV